jgi:cytoskeletal protein CcmA (bactofilin family)
MNIRSHAFRAAAALAVAAFVGLALGGAAAAPPGQTPPGQTSSGGGPHFYSGVAVDITDTVDGDVYAAGQTVTISGDVTGDVIAAAQTISISGRVDGNVRLAAQDVSITGDVARSGTIFASNLVVAGQGSVGNDIVAAGSTITVAGSVGRDPVVSAADLSIDGTVGGDVTYSSSNTAHIADGAVAGTVQHIQPQQEQSPRVEISPWAAVLGWFLGVLYALVALSLLTVAAGLLVPRTLNRVTDRLLPSPWRALLVGFLAAIVVPIGLLILLVTIVGAPLALAGLLIFTVLSLATFLVGAHYLGRVIIRGSVHPVLQSFVGGLILIVALQIPLLNILVWLAMVFFGLGAELLEIHRQSPWSTKPRAEAVAPAPEAQPAVAAPPQQS